MEPFAFDHGAESVTVMELMENDSVMVVTCSTSPSINRGAWPGHPSKESKDWLSLSVIEWLPPFNLVALSQVV